MTDTSQSTEPAAPEVTEGMVAAAEDQIEAEEAWDEFTDKSETDGEEGSGSAVEDLDDRQERLAEAAREEALERRDQGDGGGDGEGDAGADIWANATPEQRRAVQALAAENTRLDHENRSHRGRAEQARRARTPQTRDLLASEKWREFESEFGDIAEPIRELLEAQQNEIGSLRSGMETIGQDRLQSRAQSQEAEVREAHPDLEDVLNSDAFADWYAKAPTYIQEGLHRNGEHIVDAAEAIDIVSRFKADTGRGGSARRGTSRRRQIQLDGAAAPRTRSGEAAVSDKEPETEAEMWDWAKKKIARERRSV